MRNNTGLLSGRGHVGAVAIGILAVCGAALQAGVPSGKIREGSVRIRSGMPSGAEIPVSPPTTAVRTETAIWSEDGVLPEVSARGIPGSCASDRDCDDCKACTTDECVFTSGGQSGICENVQKPLCDVCGDDLLCNGIGLCDESGDCQSSVPRLCDGVPNTICDENEAQRGNDPCVTPCAAADLVDDGDFCNGTEVCDLIECVDGDAAGTPCEDDTPCVGGGFCGGVVISVNSPCGSAAACDAQNSVCKLWGRCCTADTNELSGFACSREKKDDCLGLGGTWLEIGDNAATTFDDADCVNPAPADEGNAGETFGCPAYAAGVTPPGPYLGEIGDAGFAVCSSHFDVGDDYAIPESGDGEPNADKFIRLTTFRWVGGFRQNGIQNTAGRYRIVFYDRSGVKVEDTITNGEFFGASSLRTIIFQEKPVLPARGFVVVAPASRFAPFARMFWTTTDSGGVDVGVNDPLAYWVDGGEKTVASTFPGSTGVLAYELVGDIVDSPAGACCDITTGSCIQTLPWECNGFFQGAGVKCKVCANDPFGECETSADCETCAISGEPCNPHVECPGSPPGQCVLGICNGGDRIGQACNVDLECTGVGDTCSDTVACNPVPPACALSACCVTGPNLNISFCMGGDKADNACTIDADCAPGGTCTGTTVRVGDCITVRTASCVGPDVGAGDACFSNGDCSGTNLCKADCPTGSANEGGFGTSCVPQLCAQPSGGSDTCLEARLPGIRRDIIVPSIADGPVTHTFTGDNTNATYDDHDDDVGAGNGTCNDGRFTSQGGFKDLGWWHAFSINDCAIVRVDFCGTFERSGEVHQPQWSNIMTECNPCGGSVASSVTGGPVGDDISGGDRGLPHCTGGDDLWQSYGPLAAGIYQIPVFTAPGGHFGEYQLHVTVGACPIAACCLPKFHCVDLGTQFLIRDGVTNEPITCGAGEPVPACVTGSCEPCALARETDCAEVEGFWNGLGNLPPGGASFIVDCQFDGGGACELGSCCAGAGNCQDTPVADTCDPITGDGCCDPQSPITCMNRSLCEGIENGSFVGGAQCDFPQPPCPACLIQGAENCQLPAKTPEFTIATGSVSDFTIPPNGTVSADDFIPQGDTLTSVCTWGFYHDPKLPATQIDCSGVVTDEFRVRVFADDNGIPGAMLADGESMVTGLNISRGKEPDTAFVNGFPDDTNAVPQGYTLILDDPITGMVPGARHWLEIVNNTTGPSDAAKTCWWNWLHSFPSADDEDGFSVTGGGSGGNEDPALYLAGASRYIHGSGRPYDLAFCVGTGTGGTTPLPLIPATTQKACCWTCPADGDPVPELLSLTECNDGAGVGGVWNPNDLDCSGTFEDMGDLLPDSCTGAALSRIASVGQVAPCGDGVLDLGEQCDPGPDVPGDNCDATCNLICPAPETAPTFCQGGANANEPCADITECPDQGAGTTCATLGGALTVLAGLHATDTNCAGTDGADNIPNIGGGFIGVGHDAWFFYVADCTGRVHVNACPTGSGLSKGLEDIADNTVAIYHDPDNPFVCVCPGTSTELQVGGASDEGCNGVPDAGAGIVQAIALPGECYTIRMTNWGATADAAGAGSAIFDVGCSASACFTSQPPSIHRIPDVSGTPQNNSKGRYLPIVVNNVGRESSIEVEFVSLPAPYDLWNGTKMFARAPIEICETSTVTTGPCAIDTYTTAMLECTGTPFSTDWNALGVINVWHEGIVPGGTYNVRVIDASCNPGISASFSDPTEMHTAAFGDTVGTGGFQFPAGGPPIGVDDALAGIASFSNSPNKPSKSRTELASKCITNTADIDDVLMSLSGFTGGSHPQAPTTADACAPTSTCTEQ